MGNLQSNRVLSGIYSGWTRAEMLVEFERYKSALQKSMSRLTGATINGQNYQFGPRGDMNLVSWSRAIRRALSQVDPNWLAPQSTISATFRAPESDTVPPFAGFGQ